MAVSRVPPLSRRHVVNQDACVYLVCTLLLAEKKIMPLTPAEKQRRYRNKRKLDPVKDEEARNKALDRYHKTKRLVKDLTSREHRQAKRKWRVANSKRRARIHALQSITRNTPELTPQPDVLRVNTPPTGQNAPNIPENCPIPDSRRLRTPSLSPSLLSSRHNATRKKSHEQTPRQSLFLSCSARERSTPTVTSSASASVSAKNRGRKQMRRDRTKLYRENVNLKEKLEAAERKYQKYKKKCHRLNRSKENEAKDTDKTAEKYNILTNAIKERYKKIKSRKERRIFTKIFEEQTIATSRKKLDILRETLDLQQGNFRKSTLTPKTTILRAKVIEFFKRDDISRATAGKKETITFKQEKVQRRYLLDSMKNLYKSFKKENPDLKCSYSYFSRLKPFFVLTPSISARETCLCKMHTNIQHMANCLHKHKCIVSSDLNQILSDRVCSTDSLPCMTSKCDICSAKNTNYNNAVETELKVKWLQWVRKTEMIEKDGKKIKISKNIKEFIEGTVKDLIDSFEEYLKDFARHVHFIKTQHRNYRKCINGLGINELVMHIDFSENYNCKMHEEIQGHHFGSSRNQVSLHTGVYYIKGHNSNIDVHSFCTVSENRSHNPAAIWAHLHPVLLMINEEYPGVKFIHFFSDGPATQYRQKQNFYFMCTRLFDDYGFKKFTWNYFEAGHGKGAADGVGGFLKRTADQLVATGQDIINAKQFFLNLRDKSKILMFLITNEEVALMEKQIPDFVPPLVGTMKVHQIFSENSRKFMYRDLSCYCSRGICSCLKPKEYAPVNDLVIQDVQPTPIESPLDELTVDIIKKPRQSLFHLIYSSDTDSSDDIPLSAFRDVSNNNDHNLPSTSKQSDELLQKENLHPSKIFPGTYVLLKIQGRKQMYTYLASALSEVDEDGYIQFMFYRGVNDTGKLFKAVETDTSCEPYDNIVEVVSTSKKIFKGKREYYEFPSPLEVFEQ